MLNNMLIVRKKESICKTPKQARKQLKQCQQNRRKQEEKRELEALPLYQEESLSPTNSFDSLFNSQDFGLFESMDMESVDEDVYLRPISETPSCHSEQTVSNVFASFSVRPEGSTGLIGELINDLEYTHAIFLNKPDYNGGVIPDTFWCREKCKWTRQLPVIAEVYIGSRTLVEHIDPDVFHSLASSLLS